VSLTLEESSAAACLQICGVPGEVAAAAAAGGARHRYERTETWGCNAGWTSVAACCSAAAPGSSAAAAAAAAAEYANGWGHNSGPAAVKKGPPSAATGRAQSLGTGFRRLLRASRKYFVREALRDREKAR
jgi:hypothetical protein